MRVLNLGCGTKTSSSSDVINIDWSISLRIRRNPLLSLLARAFIGGDRWQRFQSISDNILVWNLARGLPFESNCVDVTYSSHVLEHIDRNAVPAFLTEQYRVLRSGGCIRIVVPDLAQLVEDYQQSLERMKDEPANVATHEQKIAAIIEQCVRKEAHGTSLQRPMRRWLENRFLGDARTRGETHQWMYDEVSLRHLLKGCDFVDIQRRSFDTSSINGWAEYGLDTNSCGVEYQLGSLYLEAFKP